MFLQLIFVNFIVSYLQAELRSLYVTYPRTRQLVEKAHNAVQDTLRALRAPELFSAGFDILCMYFVPGCICCCIMKLLRCSMC